MKKLLRIGVAAVLSASLIVGQAVTAFAAPQETQEEELKIAVLSDTHYLSPDMIKGTDDFREHLNSDRKMFAESDAFLDALLDTVKADDPDVLLISGDLTKDGEKEGHMALAEILETFEEETGAQVYITPGNHDLNNSNAMNFNTESGEAEPAGRTSQADYKEIYSDLVYGDDTIIATFEPGDGKQGGGLSYAARPKDGFTIISIDSARYSADNTESGTDEHETSGNVSPELEAWVIAQIKEAKERGDTVIGLQHHGLVPHFSMEPDLLPMYLVNDYERISQAYADAGMTYIFTGHMHANDIAAVTTEVGNTLYDIETGSVVTYPSPARSVTISRTVENGTVSESMEVKTYTGVGPVTVTDPFTNETEPVEDITEYGREHGFSEAMLQTTVNGFLHPYYEQILAGGGSKVMVEALVGELTGMDITLNAETLGAVLPLVLPDASSGETIYYDSANGGICAHIEVMGSYTVMIPNIGLMSTIDALFAKLDNEVLANPESMDTVVNGLITELINVKVADSGETLLDFANYIYQSHLGGEDSMAQPDWVVNATSKIESGEILGTILDKVLSYLCTTLGDVCNGLNVAEILGASSYNTVSKEFTALEGRTPLIDPLDSGNLVNILFGSLGLGWGNSGDISMNHTVKELLTDLGDSFVGGLLFDEDIDPDTFLADTLEGLLGDLLLGTPEEPGVIDEEMKAEINTWLLNLVNSMGTDSNYPEDNNTTIENTWKLLTDRTALDEAIAAANELDLTKYTEETAKAVEDAVKAAEELSLTATQEEIDAAAKALTDAMAALKEMTDRTELDKAIEAAKALDLTKYTDETADAVAKALVTANNLPLTATQDEIDAAAKALNDAMAALVEKVPGTGGDEKPGSGDSEKPGTGGNEKPGNGGAPQTGDSASVISIYLFAGSGLLLILAAVLKKKLYRR